MTPDTRTFFLQGIREPLYDYMLKLSTPNGKSLLGGFFRCSLLGKKAILNSRPCSKTLLREMYAQNLKANQKQNISSNCVESGWRNRTPRGRVRNATRYHRSERNEAGRRGWQERRILACERALSKVNSGKTKAPSKGSRLHRALLLGNPSASYQAKKILECERASLRYYNTTAEDNDEEDKNLNQANAQESTRSTAKVSDKKIKRTLTRAANGTSEKVRPLGIRASHQEARISTSQRAARRFSQTSKTDTHHPADENIDWSRVAFRLESVYEPPGSLKRASSIPSHVVPPSKKSNFVSKLGNSETKPNTKIKSGTSVDPKSFKRVAFSSEISKTYLVPKLEDSGSDTSNQSDGTTSSSDTQPISSTVDKSSQDDVASCPDSVSSDRFLNKKQSEGSTKSASDRAARKSTLTNDASIASPEIDSKPGTPLGPQRLTSKHSNLSLTKKDVRAMRGGAGTDSFGCEGTNPYTAPKDTKLVIKSVENVRETVNQMSKNKKLLIQADEQRKSDERNISNFTKSSSQSTPASGRNVTGTLGKSLIGKSRTVTGNTSKHLTTGSSDNENHPKRHPHTREVTKNRRTSSTISEKTLSEPVKSKTKSTQSSPDCRKVNVNNKTPQIMKGTVSDSHIQNAFTTAFSTISKLYRTPTKKNTPKERLSMDAKQTFDKGKEAAAHVAPSSEKPQTKREPKKAVSQTGDVGLQVLSQSWIRKSAGSERSKAVKIQNKEVKQRTLISFWEGNIPCGTKRKRKPSTSLKKKRSTKAKKMPIEAQSVLIREHQRQQALKYGELFGPDVCQLEHEITQDGSGKRRPSETIDPLNKAHDPSSSNENTFPCPRGEDEQPSSLLPAQKSPKVIQKDRAHSLVSHTATSSKLKTKKAGRRRLSRAPGRQVDGPSTSVDLSPWGRYVTADIRPFIATNDSDIDVRPSSSVDPYVRPPPQSLKERLIKEISRKTSDNRLENLDNTEYTEGYLARLQQIAFRAYARTGNRLNFGSDVMEIVTYKKKKKKSKGSTAAGKRKEDEKTHSTSRRKRKRRHRKKKRGTDGFRMAELIT